jgi:hypothetical protein
VKQIKISLIADVGNQESSAVELLKLVNNGLHGIAATNLELIK